MVSGSCMRWTLCGWFWTFGHGDEVPLDTGLLLAWAGITNCFFNLTYSDYPFFRWWCYGIHEKWADVESIAHWVNLCFIGSILVYFVFRGHIYPDHGCFCQKIDPLCLSFHHDSGYHCPAGFPMKTSLILCGYIILSLLDCKPLQPIFAEYFQLWGPDGYLASPNQLICRSGNDGQRARFYLTFVLNPILLPSHG